MPTDRQRERKNNQNKEERKIEMGDKSPKAIKKMSAHEQTKTKKAKKKEKHSALFQQSTATINRK
jgi:hypothetical protein